MHCPSRDDAFVSSCNWSSNCTRTTHYTYRYTLCSEKNTHFWFLAITSANIDRFSKFFHHHTQQRLLTHWSLKSEFVCGDVTITILPNNYYVVYKMTINFCNLRPRTNCALRLRTILLAPAGVEDVKLIWHLIPMLWNVTASQFDSIRLSFVLPALTDYDKKAITALYHNT